MGECGSILDDEIFWLGRGVVVGGVLGPLLLECLLAQFFFFWLACERRASDDLINWRQG